MDIDFHNLPDYINRTELELYFCQVLEATESTNFAKIVDALWELADRQWHTYSILDKDVKYRVDMYVTNLLLKTDWDKETIKVLRQLLSVIGNLGLANSYAILLSLRNDDMNPSILSEIDSYIREIEIENGNQIENPYFNLGPRLSE